MRFLIGIGNYHGGDDSIGLLIAETISERGLDIDFRAIDMGGNLLDLVHYIGSEVEQVLIVDSALMGSTPGDFAFFPPDAVVSRKSSGGVSTHEGDLLNVLELATSLEPEIAPIVIMGIEPASLGDGQGLSPALRDRFEEYVDAAVAFLQLRGGAAES